MVAFFKIWLMRLGGGGGGGGGGGVGAQLYSERLPGCIISATTVKHFKCCQKKSVQTPSFSFPLFFGVNFTSLFI